LFPFKETSQGTNQQQACADNRYHSSNRIFIFSFSFFLWGEFILPFGDFKNAKKIEVFWGFSTCQSQKGI
jgi:hypothetical protein